MRNNCIIIFSLFYICSLSTLSQIRMIEYSGNKSNAAFYEPSPSYTEGFLLLTKTRQSWNSNTSMYKNDSLFIYSYNDINLLDTLFINVANGGNGWVITAGYTYIYDQSNKLKELYYYLGNFSQSTFRYRYIYSGNKLIQKIKEQWIGSEWLDIGITSYNWNNFFNFITLETHKYRHSWYGFWCYSFKYEYSYNSGNQLLTKIEYDGDCCPAWYLYKQKLYTYDEFGNNILTLGQEWNSADSIWINDIIYRYQYDVNNSLILTIIQDWDPENAQWKNVWRISYTYMPGNLPATTLKEKWSEENGWVNYTYRAITYDNLGDWIEDITQIWDSTAWKNYFRYSATWDNPLSVNYDPENDNTYELSQNYPNPFNPTTKIKFTIPQTDSPLPGGARGGFVTLKVYDVLGNEIATLVNEEKQPGTYEVEFAVGQDSSPDISSGIYFYQLKAGNYIETKKMLLLK